jgi:hypothetical protein
MPAQQRFKYWQTVINRSDELGAAFQQMSNDPDIASKVKPFAFWSVALE